MRLCADRDIWDYKKAGGFKQKNTPPEGRVNSCDKTLMLTFQMTLEDLLLCFFRQVFPVQYLEK